jgi:hypothetical protein
MRNPAQVASLVSSKNCSHPANLKSSQHLLPHAAATPKAVTAIAMAVIVDATVDVAVNAANGVNEQSDQQAQPPMLRRTQKARAKQNRVKKAVVAIVMVAPSALKARAPMQTL